MHKEQVVVFGHPGIVELVNVGTGPIRGFNEMDKILYVVSGGTLYSVTKDLVVAPLGRNGNRDSPVSMDNNGTQLVITNGVNGYIYSVATSFGLISDPDFNPAETVTFFDERFLFDWKDTNKFFCSEILDGTSYDALQYASAETRPDNVVAVVLNKQVLLVFGTKSTEPWQNVGAANFPFERVPGVMIERGLAAPHATAKDDNSVFFLGDDRVFYRLDGVSPVRISQHGLEREWQKYKTVSDAFCFSYAWNGHKFISLTFPSANVTVHYDIATGLWHDRESRDINGRSLGRWRGNCGIEVFDKVLVGDAVSGSVGFLSDATYDEFGTTVQMIATSPPLHDDLNRTFIGNFQMDLQTGVGVTSGQGSNPQAMLRISRDGGFTFGESQRYRSMGKIGQYLKRLKWLRLGQAREWVFEITISDPVNRVIAGAYVDGFAGK
jgi:hypothetical protein